MVKISDNQLTIQMNGFLVGILQKHSNGALSFYYDKSWLSQPGARSLSLSLPLIDQLYQGDVVYNFFDNLLPDSPNVRARIQAKFHIKTSHPFDLLAVIGKDCVGALQLGLEKSTFIKTIEAEPLTAKAIANLLNNYLTSPLGMVSNESDFRISIAGAQEKSALLFYRQKWCRPKNCTPTSHILKLPIGHIPHQNLNLSESCENEWLCSQIIHGFGLPVATAEILYFDLVKVLSVERFDRRWSKDETWLMRLPQEDFCQALGYSPNLKYEADVGPGIVEILKLLRYSSNPDDQAVFFCSQIVFFLLAAIDGHAKNFSIFIEPQGRYRLTPLYDIISAFPLIKAKQLQSKKIKMAMALIGKNKHYVWESIQRRHFISTAKAAQFSPEIAEQLIQKISNQVESVIEAVRSALPNKFPKPIADAIFSGMRTANKRLIN